MFKQYRVTRKNNFRTTFWERFLNHDCCKVMKIRQATFKDSNLMRSDFLLVGIRSAKAGVAVLEQFGLFIKLSIRKYWKSLSSVCSLVSCRNLLLWHFHSYTKLCHCKLQLIEKKFIALWEGISRRSHFYRKYWIHQLDNCGYWLFFWECFLLWIGQIRSRICFCTYRTVCTHQLVQSIWKSII